jgi:ATP-binding cassette subfamily B protein
LPVIAFIKNSKKLSSKQSELHSKLTELVTDSAENIKLIYGYNLQNYSNKTFNDISRDLQETTNKTNIARSIFFSCLIGFICISITLIIWVGSYQILSNNLSSGSLVAFMTYAIMSVSSLVGILNNFSEIQPQFNKLDKLFQLINTNLYEDTNHTIRSLPDNFDIHFDEVDFSYPKRDAMVLNKFTNYIKSGEFITIHGKSGIGKSTLLYLLLKFYQPLNGTIRINNLPLSDIATKLIRKNFVFVNQDPLIFSASILENITLGKVYSKKELNKVIEICGLENLLQEMPEGLNTHTGQKGFKISGGQKQRICIARSLILNPQVLMLDEATNALDSDGENQILHNIRSTMNDKTIIFISHNQKIINISDRSILVA